jgi:hypothetical protein
MEEIETIEAIEKKEGSEDKLMRRARWRSIQH